MWTELISPINDELGTKGTKPSQLFQPVTSSAASYD
jgi:hypothetical protein